MTRRTFLVAVVLFSGLSSSIEAQSNSSVSSTRDYWEQRKQSEQRFSTAFNDVISKCRADGLTAAADTLQRFVIPRDPQRQYIFIPPENRVGADPLPVDFPEGLRNESATALRDHAAALFKLACEQAEQGDGATAFQLLHEVLFFSPDHREARRILGHRKIEDDDQKRWRVSSDRLKIKKANRPYEQLGWPTGSYLIASTSHFQIASRASQAETEFLAQQLERWHDVWRQVFFEYYQRAKNLRSWVGGKGNYRQTTRKFDIVFFANEKDYVDDLSRHVPGVEASTGYYHDGQKTSYFYSSDDVMVRETWRHELTHQLFQESKRSVLSPFADEFLWLGEGIALYFESLTDFDDYVTLGGFDARRLQYARLRKIKEQFYISASKLSQLSRIDFQAQNDIARVYSQSAGITHYLMTDEFGAMRRPLIDFLQLSYQGKLKPGSFEKLIGKSFAEIDSQYTEFLKIKSSQLSRLSAPETRQELTLIAATLKDDSLDGVGRCTNLVWLDLSACDVRGNRLTPLRSCRNLRQLFLTGALVDSESMEAIASLPIGELDLSGTSITDAELELLAASKTLKSLNVSGTRVTQTGLNALKSRRTSINVVAD